MAQTKLQQKLTKALADVKNTAYPWNLLSSKVPFNATMHNYPLRKNTMPPAVKLYPALIYAMNEYFMDHEKMLQTAADSGRDPLSTLEYRMVTKGNGAETLLEYRLPDDSSMLIVARADKFRACLHDPDGARSDIGRFNDLDSDALSMIALALTPHILGVDEDTGNGDIRVSAEVLTNALVDAVASPDPWADQTEIPDLVKDSAYFMDAAMTVLKEKLVIDCGPDNVDTPAEIEDSYYQIANGFTGALITEYLKGDWEPKYVKANGKARKVKSSIVTIADAKQLYSNFSAHRTWTQAEKERIPYFPDTQPVMKEVLLLMKNIIFAKDTSMPINNAMWRGVTGYGKSTGVKMFACIANMPLLIQTCHPNMETSDFLSTIQPYTGASIPLDMTAVQAHGEYEEESKHPYFKDAMAHLDSLSETELAEVMDYASFIGMCLMDTDSAIEQLLGRKENLDPEETLVLYAEVTTARKTAPLRTRISELELAKENANKADSEKMEFVHVIAPYLKGMVNGYLVEIQEASRIRDSGVLVGLNEFTRPGSKIELMNGTVATRHRDAICIFTDNVGYSSCRPVDPSVIRRMDYIIDSPELEKEEMIARAQLNAGYTDKTVIEKCYKLWECVKDYCAHNAITDGSTSPVELDRLVQAVAMDGEDAIWDYALQMCVVSKATSSIEDQRDIMTACRNLVA